MGLLENIVTIWKLSRSNDPAPPAPAELQRPPRRTNEEPARIKAGILKARGIDALFVRVDRAACDACGACAVVCPDQAIEMKASGPEVDHDQCAACGACCSVCAREALEMVEE
jgi:Pyruvate/2-oxoacid:ferredoxin oxidoreductase delta subunit